jgi:hypothetical protein
VCENVKYLISDFEIDKLTMVEKRSEQKQKRIDELEASLLDVTKEAVRINQNLSTATEALKSGLMWCSSIREYHELISQTINKIKPNK